jgi:alpha-methylacyl-CoA racemase
MRNIERCRIDLKNDDGRSVTLDLIADADVVIEGFRPGVADRLGVGYEASVQVNPKIVYCAATGYGQTGPYASWAGHDLNYVAVAGYLDAGGRAADGMPTLPGATIADAAGGGLQAAMATMAALLRRIATGEGSYLDVSATDGVIGLMSMNIDEHFATGIVPGPGHGVLTGRYACYGVYECSDGRYLTLAAIEPKFFLNACRELGLLDWVARQYDDSAQVALAEVLRAAFAQQPRDVWVERLAPLDTCIAPVLSVAEIANNPQLTARHVLAKAVHPNWGEFTQLGPVWAGSAQPDGPYVLGEEGATDTVEVLKGLSYSQERIFDLQARGVVE